MQPKQLLLRCFIKCEGGVYSAVCVDLNLAAQAESAEDVKSKLESMILSYVNDSLGKDNEYADYLLTRKSPASIMAEYYYARIVTSARLNRLFRSLRSVRSFMEPMPLRLA